MVDCKSFVPSTDHVSRPKPLASIDGLSRFNSLDRLSSSSSSGPIVQWQNPKLTPWRSEVRFLLGLLFRFFVHIWVCSITVYYTELLPREIWVQISADPSPLPFTVRPMVGQTTLTRWMIGFKSLTVIQRLNFACFFGWYSYPLYGRRRQKNLWYVLNN